MPQPGRLRSLQSPKCQGVNWIRGNDFDSRRERELNIRVSLDKMTIILKSQSAFDHFLLQMSKRKMDLFWGSGLGESRVGPIPLGSQGLILILHSEITPDGITPRGTII